MVRGAVKVVGGILLSIVLSGNAFAGAAQDQPQTRLMEGNKRFVTGKPAKKNIGESRRRELAKGQSPFAIVVTCSDSRVAPEVLFDQGLGDIFVVRVAGNVVDPVALGSIEYAAEHLHSSMLVILGHQSCGAVKAAIEAEGEPEGNIGAIIGKIKPAVEAAKATGKKDKELLDAAVQENVKNVYSEIMEKSPVVKELSHEGKLKVVMGEYYLDSGEVKLLKP